ncbi:hypothetical protein [Pseudoalteromonas denitrificans]|uniref:Uncharacterized protein n=1 Tax=Pseudoalteromonas denitrificans DSM 6059 TaxID=1123010 RepID=A0A1I1U9F4_9GAMM|nr:hypothetical protein [Pseudoalteromonas denitrificans]SFD67265.1 hypothetical protein SAMN02745724_05152 [Pseudoalteromonas denitrificans DSM 6059]
MKTECPPITLVKTWLTLTTKNYPMGVRARATKNINKVFGNIYVAEAYVEQYDESAQPEVFDPVI